MNQGTARIVIIVALVAVGAVVLANGFDGGGSAAGAPSGSETPSPTGTPSPTVTTTPTPTETPSPQQPSQVIFMALNGTDVTGLAAQVQETLEEAGYTPAQDPGNTPTGSVQVTTVYFRGGANAAQNQSDAQYLADTFFEGAEVAKLGPAFDDVVPSVATVAIVVGQDYADLVAAGE